MIFSACRSSWICVSAFALWTVAARAQEGALHVRPADREQYSTEPRQIVAAPFTVLNSSASAIEVEPRLIAPEGWLVVGPPAPFVLAAHESAMKLVSFAIPEDAAEGGYRVSYAVRDRRRPAVEAGYAVSVHVAAAGRLQATLLDVPDLAVAGDTVKAAVVFRNAGNTPLDVEYTVSTRFIDSIAPRRGRLELGPAESRRLDLEIITAAVRDPATARISVAAAAKAGAVDVAASVRATLQVVPRARARDALRLLDSRVEARYVARDSAAGRSAGWQPAISGGGFLDDGHKRLLRYRLRGPDRRRSGSYGAPEESWLQYQDPHFAAGAGDQTFGLSPLTEPGRLGRGAQLAVRQNRWDLEAYGMRDDFGSGSARQIGVGSSWRVLSHTSLGLNLLDRAAPRGSSRIWSLRGESEPDAGLTLDAEVGGNGGAPHGRAARIAMRDERFATRYYLLGWRADRGFEGPLRDKLYLSSGFERANPAGWSWRGYYRQQDWNLTPLDEIDPDERERRADSERMRVAPLQRQLSFGTARALGSLANLSVDVVRRERGARESSAWRAGLTRSWRNLSLSFTQEHGEARVRDTDDRFATVSRQLTGSLRVGRAQSYGFYWVRDRGSELDEQDPRRESRGFTANYVAGGLAVKVDAQRSFSRAGHAAVYELSLSREWERGARLTIAARRIEGRFARDDYLLGFSLPFGLPVARRHGLAVVRGRVLDAETADGLANVTLRMDGLAVETNRRGEFAFPAVSPGTHRIALDQRGLEMRQVPDSLAPLDVTVGAETPPVSIRLVRSVAIGVRVTLRAADGATSMAAPGMIVRFRHGATEIRRLTDDAGCARLAGVPPGRWSMDVAEESLTDGVRSLAGEVVLEIEPGARAETRIDLAPQRREIRMLTPVAVRQAITSSTR